MKEQSEFWSCVDQSAGEHGCWTWTRGRQSGGYGHPVWRGKKQLAHRLAYEFVHGAIPDGLVIDHRCANKLCCNPRHLEAVPPIVNIRRGSVPWAVVQPGTHCKNGHEFTPATTVYHGGQRRCLPCYRKYQRELMRARRAAGIA